MARPATKKKIREKVLELRTKGYTHKEIAIELDIDSSESQRLFSEGMMEIEKGLAESAWEARQLDLMRLDAILKANMDSLSREVYDEEQDTMVNIPDSRAADTVLKTLDRRAKLLGLWAEEPADMNALATKVNDLLEKDVNAMTDDELDQFFTEHFKAEQDSKK